ncbi:MAG: gamma carbonic anhydrase family protein [Caulobacteraceae bacterium]
MEILYKQYIPQIDKNVFKAPGSMIIGRCYIEENCSIWFNAVLRADVNEIWISKNSNIQDGVVIHCDHDFPVRIGENVTVGHNAIIHGCTIGNNCIIGMGATILDGAMIGENVIVGANSLITSGKVIPSGVLVVGSPAKVKRELSDTELEGIKESAKGYIDKAKEYMKSIKE